MKYFMISQNHFSNFSMHMGHKGWMVNLTRVYQYLLFNIIFDLTIINSRFYYLSAHSLIIMWITVDYFDYLSAKNDWFFKMLFCQHFANRVYIYSNAKLFSFIHSSKFNFYLVENFYYFFTRFFLIFTVFSLYRF